VWPLISQVLADGAPSEQAAEVVAMLDDWVADDAPRLDADDDEYYDEPGPVIMDTLWAPLVRAALEPGYGDQYDVVDEARNLEDGETGVSMIDKDLRTLLGEEVERPFHLRYCGAGDLDECRLALWGAVEEAVEALVLEYGEDPAEWLAIADRTTFVPELIPDSMRRTNRPTFQQVLQFVQEQ
jgi:hypothetical protein